MSTILKIFLQTRVRRFNNDYYLRVLQCCTPRLAKRNEILLRPGQISRSIYFVNKGCIRTYSTNNEGIGSTLDFAFEGTFNMLLPPFFCQEISNHYLQAVEESELFAIRFEDFRCLGRIIPDFHWSRWAYPVENAWVLQGQINVMNALERYLWLLENRPEIVRRINGKLIASYLGMTTRTLSRVRAQI